MTTKQPNRITQSLLLPAQFVLLLWAIHLVQTLLHLDLGVYGVFPRNLIGLRGVIFSPLLHSNWAHLFANTPPLFFLSAMILFFYRRVAIPAFIMIYLLTGLAVWGFGRGVFHIGASGVVYGLVAFVFWNGIFRRNLKSIALALIVVFYYGSMFMGILPGQEGISWESHLLGGLAGIFTAYWFRDRIERDEEKKVYSWENEPEQPPQTFLDPDIFEKTKTERQKDAEPDEDLPGWFSNRTW
ncbi:MAG: hypothetical protein DHS20C18_13330 [Saprospiraceae bacterium]|nr:MAG: hypothetical protein DHS20C18_13330 [Saprospiraceae bacterium]